jgi:hypothetical protein
VISKYYLKTWKTGDKRVTTQKGKPVIRRMDQGLKGRVPVHILCDPSVPAYFFTSMALSNAD